MPSLLSLSVEGSESTEEDWTWEVDDEGRSVADAGGDAVRSIVTGAVGALDGGSRLVWINDAKALGKHSLGQTSG